MSKPTKGTEGPFFKYEDGSGQVKVVDSLDRVPEKYRSSAKKVKLSEQTADADAYTYEDSSGTQHIVDSLSEVPAKYKKLAEKVSLDDMKQKALDGAKKLKKTAGKKAKSIGKDAKKLQHEIGDVVPFAKELDLPSVAVGFGLALTVFVAVSFVRRTGRVLFKVAVIMLIVCLFTGAYFAWLRRAAGLGDTKLASPKVMIDDAKDAARKMNTRIKKQERLLEKIDRGSRE